MPDSTVPYSRAYAVQGENFEVDEGPRPGTTIEPYPEEYEGTVFPYRGTETHGVHPLYSPVPPAEEWEGGMAQVRDEEESEDPKNAMPVRVVKIGPREIDLFRVNRSTVDGIARTIVNKMPNRTSFKVTNLDAAKTIFVGDQANLQPYTGYPLKPGESFSVDADNEVYGISADGTVVEVAVLLTFSSELK